MKTNTVVSLPARINQIARSSILITAFIFVLMAVPQSAIAELATYEEMHDVAENWLTYIISETGDWGGAINPHIIDVQDLIVNDTLLARYYEISAGGYIIVPALKELPPVKAYTDQFPMDIYEADGFAALIREVLQHRNQIFVEVYGSLEASQPPDEQPLFDFKNRDRWDLLAVSPKEFVSSTNKAQLAGVDGVDPLLNTSWHQGAPYNALCPDGDGGQCVVGCVATAAAQIQYYHQWPPAGEGSHSYRWGGDNSCGGSTPSQTLTADFSDPYVYDNSPAELAEICYEMGVAFEMDYGYCGSGAWTLYGSVVFPTYYRYDESTRREYRDQHSAYSWFELIKNDLNKGRPILYRISGHAIVCDGWRVSGSLNQYHFNYGWGGSQNAWYTVDGLYCPWDGCNYLVEQMVVNIIPKNGSPWLTDSEFTDDLGDGDGIPEGGETIDMSITVANFGGAPITDVSLNLSIDDASLTIVNGSSYLGDINANDSASNSADPFVFDVPSGYIPRIDSFTVEITWNGGTELDTLVIEKAIGQVSILLVDDDDSGDRNEYYEECLEKIRVPYDVWEFSSFSTPSAEYMSNYDIVMWFTGDYMAYPISNPEIESMQGYLDGGGNLFLTGQRIAAELSTVNPLFLNDYLKANFHGTQNIPVLSTQNGIVHDTGAMVAIQGGNSASNQEYPDLISATGGAVDEMKYLGSDYFGAVSYSGTYKLVFYSFGFEAIVNDDSRWRDRDSVMSDILNFFGYVRPFAYPTVLDISVAPGEPMHLLDHTPNISWSFSDAGASPQSQYHVQVSSDNNWAVPEMWDYGPVTGSDLQVEYAGLELVDGGHYYIRVRGFNGSLWSDWAEGEMLMNSVPEAATDLSPSNMEAATSATPTLSHTNAVDGEYDDLIYTYEVYADAEMTTLVDQISDHPEGTAVTSCITSVSLNDNTVYYWRVRGSDPYEDGQWTEPAEFWVNSVNSAPDAFELVNPPDGGGIPELTATLDWEAATDADPYDRVKYKLYYSTSPTLSPFTSVSDIDTNSYVLSGLDYGVSYYWKILATDLFNGQTFSTSVFSFETVSRGDANSDGEINVADAVYLINHIFKSGPAPEPVASGDANCDDDTNVGDAVFIINYVFKGGPDPGCN